MRLGSDILGSAGYRLTTAAALAALVIGGTAMAQTAPAPGRAQVSRSDDGISPAVCGVGDVREPGIQGDVPAGQTANYNCGVQLVGQLPLVGAVQGFGKCAYVRPRGGPVHVIDVSDPTRPVQVASVPVKGGSETMRVVVADKRAILVSGSSVYDIRDCLHPALKGEIPWPPLAITVVTQSGETHRVSQVPHDIRVNRQATKIYASMGLWEADISNLDDSRTWKVTDLRCEMAAQVAGPWQEMHRQSLAAGLSLCAEAAQPSPIGNDYALGTGRTLTSMMMPQLSHSPDFNADDTRLYVGDQAGGSAGLWSPVPKVRIVDLTQNPPKIIGEVDGAGHGLDWFRVKGREYVLHSNESGLVPGPDGKGDSCRPHPRPASLGWAYEALISDVTSPEQAKQVSMIRIAINDPEFCKARQASGGDSTVAYHMVDNPLDAHFAAVSFGSAGLRIFDIRDPLHPSEVAYFNHGPLEHAGVSHYDAARGLLYVPGGTGLWVLQIEPQVRARLGV